MLERILESLDKDVFNSDSKRLIREEFDSAVKMKAELMSESVIDEYELKIDELNEKIEEYETKLSTLEAKAEEYVQFKLDEMKNDKAEEYDRLILEKLDLYLGKIVEEFIKDAKDSLVESVESKELEVMREAYQAMVESAGLEFNNSILGNIDSVANNEIRALKRQVNESVKDNLQLKQENEKLLKHGTIRELSEGLTLIEAKRFERMSETIPFSRDEKYLERLETLRESVKSVHSKDDKEEAKEEARRIVESTKHEKTNLFNFEHLV